MSPTPPKRPLETIARDIHVTVREIQRAQGRDRARLLDALRWYSEEMQMRAEEVWQP